MTVRPGFFERLQVVEHLLEADRPSDDEARKLREIVQGDSDLIQAVFRLITSPDWIGPLRTVGCFDAPPQAESLDEGHAYHPRWPQAEYLSRMADDAPRDVARAFAAMQTDNQSILRAMVRAAKRLPPDDVELLRERLVEFMRLRASWIDRRDVAGIAADLVAHGRNDSAFEILEAVVQPTQLCSERGRREVELWLSSSFRETIVPAFTHANLDRLMQLLLDWLRAVLDESGVGGTAAESWRWRPAIEEHAQNNRRDPASALVGAIRQACDAGVGMGVVTPVEVLAFTDSQSESVFERLGLYVLATYPDQLAARVQEELPHWKERLSSAEFKHEYAYLLRRCFRMMPKTKQAEYLEWADSPPDMADFDKAMQASVGRSATKEEKQRREEYSRFEKLHLIADYLEGDRREFYERMLKAEGVPVLADFSLYSSIGVKRVPRGMTLADLEGKSLREAVEAVGQSLESRHARRRLYGSGSIEALREYLQGDVTAASAEAAAVVGARSECVEVFVDEMTRASREGKTVHVEPMLELCEWALRQGEDGSEAVDDFEGRVTWAGLHVTVGDFIERMCAAGIDQSHRDGVWELIKRLQEVVEPSQAELSGVTDPRFLSAVSLTINNRASRALLRVLDYAQWLSRDEDGKIRRGALADMPEVQEALEQVLEGDQKSDYAIRGVFGERWALLYWIGEQWVRERVDAIFDLNVIEEDPAHAYGWAAWNAYLFSSRPYKGYLDLLRSKYRYAVEQAAALKDVPDQYERSFERLGEHLLLHFGWGHVGWDDDDELVKRLVTEAHPKVRVHAVSEIGSILNRAEGDLAPGMVERLQRLWERYWAEVGQRDAGTVNGQSLFGWWFACQRFPAEWRLERLREFVEECGQPEPDSVIMEELQKITTSANALTAVEIVQKLLDGDKEGWHAQVWKDEAFAILRIVMQAGDAARRIGVDVIDKLGRRGFLEFGELLDLDGNGK